MQVSRVVFFPAAERATDPLVVSSNALKPVWRVGDGAMAYGGGAPAFEPAAQMDLAALIQSADFKLKGLEQVNVKGSTPPALADEDSRGRAEAPEAMLERLVSSGGGAAALGAALGAALIGWARRRRRLPDAANRTSDGRHAG